MNAGRITIARIALSVSIGMLLGAAVCCGQTPATELQAAVLDCAKLPPAQRLSCRYISLYSISPPDRAEAAKVLAFACNSLSRTRAITPPKFVTDTLARIDIYSYAPSASEFKDWSNAWEKLGETEPTWHIRTEVIDHIPPAKKGGEYTTSTRITTVDGGWIGLADAQKLKAYTASNSPLLTASYFIANALTTPRYYQFAGIPDNENDFLKSLGVDAKVIDRLRANAGANLIISGVTSKPRRAIWSQGPLGGVYETLDVLQVDAERDPIRRPITAQGLTTKYDVSEWYTMGANGLWKTSLFDAKGKVQQSVPDRVAKDTSDPLGDGIVIPLVSCARCHVEGGLRPFVDDQTKLLSKSLLTSYDAAIILRAQEFYDEPRLQRQMKFDRETYAAAVRQVTRDANVKGDEGMTPAEISTALAKVVRNYSYLPVKIGQAALECGVDVKEFRAATVNTHDPILLTLIEDRDILRDQWSSSFAEAALACEARRTK